ncbi:hypothetical protein PoHVEF18_006789 [Penicillium ochrochloron]
MPEAPHILASICLCLGNVILGHLMAALAEPLFNGLLNAHFLDASKAPPPDTPTPRDLRSFTQRDLQPVRIPREFLATITEIPACQDLGKALAHLQNATGVTRTPTSHQNKQNDDVLSRLGDTLAAKTKSGGWTAERQSPLKKQ